MYMVQALPLQTYKHPNLFLNLSLIFAFKPRTQFKAHYFQTDSPAYFAEHV
jgi:hypothetical protein